MKTFGRILAVSVIIVSVISIVLSLFSIVGVWQISIPLATSLTKMATIAEAGLKTIDQGMQKIDPILGLLQQSMKEIDANAEKLKADMQTGNPLIGMMADVLGVDVAPKVKEVRETLQSLRELAESVNATVEMFNNLPFVDLATIGDATQKIVDLFDQVSAAIDEIQAGVGKLKQNVSGSVIDPIQSQSRKVDQILGEAQAEVQTLQRKVNLAYELMVVVGPRIPQIIAVISVLITVLLVWGILAQIAMIYLAWLYWKFGRLDLHKALPATAEA